MSLFYTHLSDKNNYQDLAVSPMNKIYCVVFGYLKKKLWDSVLCLKFWSFFVLLFITHFDILVKVAQGLFKIFARMEIPCHL